MFAPSATTQQPFASRDFGSVASNSVLGGARQGDFSRDVPRFWFFKVLQALFFGVSGHAFAAYPFSSIKAAVALRSYRCQGRGQSRWSRKRSILLHPVGWLFGGVLRHVAGAGNQHAFAFNTVVAGFQHGLGKIHAAVAGGFRANQAAAPFEALAGQDGKIRCGFFCIVRTDSRFPRPPTPMSPAGTSDRHRCGGRVQS